MKKRIGHEVVCQTLTPNYLKTSVMHIMYVDESGDPGIHQYGSPFFILSGLIVSQDEWQKYLDRLKTFRKSIKPDYNLLLRAEVHASELIRINKTSSYRRFVSKKLPTFLFYPNGGCDCACTLQERIS
jgi:hypothetical protein